jgi:hypothetical protein
VTHAHAHVGSRNAGYPRRSGYARQANDWYVEPRWCIDQLLDHENFEGEILDPCCGGGTIPSVCLERGLQARGSDLIDRGFGEVQDLFSITEPVDNVISNIPYNKAEAFTRHILGLIRRKAALILPMPFWESRIRQSFFQKHPPVRWYPCSDRPSMPPGQWTEERDQFGALIQPKASGGTAPYGWWIFERGYQGPTAVCFFELWDRPKT